MQNLCEIRITTDSEEALATYPPGGQWGDIT